MEVVMSTQNIQINQLPLFKIGDDMSSYSHGESTYWFDIAIFQLGDGTLTWRGVDQFSPKGKLLGIAFLLFAGDSEGAEWPLNIRPMAIMASPDLRDLLWRDFHWETHHINWTSDGHGRLIAAQFCHA